MTSGYVTKSDEVIWMAGFAHTRVKLFTRRVEKLRNPFMMNPASIHFISEMPDPAAYFARFFTRCAATNENDAYNISISVLLFGDSRNICIVTYREDYVDHILCRPSSTPRMPRVTSILVLILDLPATKLLIQPPAVIAVPCLEVRKPFRDDRNNSSIHANSQTYVPTPSQAVAKRAAQDH